ncbi:hypothetical protein A5669_15805 [Mycolicibacterium fortuitum]|uniref:DUF262 domain-containing protein n=1 Tax=Mycolicibacterium fortuitum TaxID=1766 RepID=UPI0007E9E8E8|nr:DUF262 domain-containing protein [Mycolicibacterium fortuitum]MBN3459504.1 DUF262 domain-containing protein [Mycobacterium sp. DSM 3803]OBG56588.1 hypothetical protein A5669_15805 [Mycolicibacterium fortuitum]
MEAHQRSPRDLFEGKEHFEIPAFQRPYVWNEEDQWAPLWDDVVRVAESYVVAKETGAQPSISQHFLGAVVYETKPPVTGDVTRHEVIDGQQRMTTLQLLLDAVHQVVDERGHELLAEALEDLILNKSKAFAGKRERFKLWPSQADRQAFTYAMAPEGTWDGEHRIIDAHAFFRQEAARWLIGKPDDDGSIPPGPEELRVEALCSTLQDRLALVAIDLSGHDDSQLIFETLNDRGTPLLKADLIKNWVFRKGEAIGADVEKWSVTHWSDFDDSWWRDEISQGRHVRSRVDIFLQYWLTMRTRDEVKAEHAFRVFAEYAEPHMIAPESADALLAELRKDADIYRNFAQLDHETVEGRFYNRVVETMELAAITPVFLWVLSENHDVPDTQIRIGLEALESWVIRRTLLRLTTKDVNKFMVSILKTLDGVSSHAAGEKIESYLSEQTAGTRWWPTDAELMAQLPEAKLYGNIRQSRLRVVLGAVEQHLRDQSPMYETVQLPSGLEIEHIMPRGWRAHWDTTPPLSEEDAARRDKQINTIGNLTLATKSLNASLSNRPWTDSAAKGLVEGGEPGKGKRTLLDAFSLLVLNKEILQGHDESWTDDDIAKRSARITQAICAVWPGPSSPQEST